MQELTYTKEDFLNSTKPYEDLYALKNDKFTHTRMLAVYAEYAKSVKFTGFLRTYKAYAESQSQSTNNEIVGNVTAFEGQQFELDSGVWNCDEYGVSTSLGQFGEVQACIHPIMPVQRLINIDTNNEKLEISYKKGGIWRRIIADKEVLASNKIISLANTGIAVNSENAKYLIRYLHDIENINYERIPEMKSIGRCGWIEGHGFSPYVEELVFDGEESFKKLFNSIKRKGTLENWKEVANEARQTLQARIVLASSFASVLVQPLGCLPFFTHIWSSVSGTGKTLALMLAASVWANPSKGEYWSTFNSTGVGQEMQAGFLNSLPLILDELQLVKEKKNFDKTIYQLSEGIGRTRGAKTGGLQRTETWGNTIITSGEMPMTTFSSGAGAINRIVELNCDEKLFKDGVKTAADLRANYGIAGKKFVEWLEQEGNLDIAKKTFDLYINEFQKTDITDKQIMAASLILTADTLVSQIIFNDDNLLTVEQVSEFLKTKTDMDINKRAYEYMIQVCSMNPNRFIEGEDNKGELWGKSDDDFFYLFRLQFSKICQEGGFDDVALLSWLKKNNLIEVVRGNLKTKSINGAKVSCVWLRKEPYENMTLEEESEEDPF